MCSDMKFGCTDRVHPRGDGMQPLSNSQTKLSRLLQWTTVNVLIFDTGHLFLPHPDPTLLSLSLSLTVALPLSLRVTGSDREQMLNHTATTKLDTATRIPPFCHLPLLKVLDICHPFYCPFWISSDTDRKAVETDETKAGFNSVQRS